MFFHGAIRSDPWHFITFYIKTTKMKMNLNRLKDFLVVCFVVFVMFFCRLSLANEVCNSHTIVGYSAQQFDGNEYKNITTSGCLENSNKAYKITLIKGHTINTLSLGNETILVGQLQYSYDDKLWFLYSGAISFTSGNKVNLTIPLFARYIQLTLGSTSGLTKCVSFAVYACDNEAAPAVSLTPKLDITFSNSVNILCTIQGQPHPQVTWTTLSGYVFNSNIVSNRFTTTAGAQNSTLMLSKQVLSNHKFKCLQNSPPCATVVCSARYPQSDVSKSARVNIDIGPSPQSNFSTKLVMHHSAIVTWQKPMEDAIMNYTAHRLIITSILGPPVIIYIPPKNRELEVIRYSIPNLQPCIFYVVELLTNNYLGESTGVKTDFTTPGGVTGVSVNAKAFNSSAVSANWSISVLTGNCRFLKVTEFVIMFKCLSGLSELSLCMSARNIYRNESDRNTTIGNLNPSTLYTLQITALTEEPGVNVTSKIVRFTTNDSIPTGGPANFSAIGLNTTTIEVRWDKVPDHKSHGIITHYMIKAMQENDTVFNGSYASMNKSNMASIYDLHVCTEYRFSIQGCNKIGCGPASAIKQRTSDKIDSTYVNNITFIEDSPNSIIAKIQLNKVSSYQCVIGFDVDYRKQNEVTWIRIKSQSTNINVFASGLEPYTTYEFRSRLNGQSSSGDWSAIIQSTTAEGIPGPIKDLQIYSRSNSSAVIIWNDPLMPRGAIQGYVIDIQGSRDYNKSFDYRTESRIMHNQAVGLVMPNITISMPFAATLYNICIKAMNNRHTGDCRNISIMNAARPPLKPDRLTVQQSTIINSKINLNFHRVPDLNGPITKYQVIVLIRHQSNEALPRNFTNKLTDFKTAMAEGLSFYITLELGPLNTAFDVGDGSLSRGLFNAPLDRSLNYTIFIRAATVWNGKAFYSPLSHVQINRYPIQEKPVFVTGGHSATSITIKFPIFNAQVKYIRVMVQKLNNSNDSPFNLDQYKEAHLQTYSEAKKMGFVTPYVTAELGKPSFENLDRFVIGDGKSTSRLKRYSKRSIPQTQTAEYFNGPLEPMSLYAVSFRAYHSQFVYFSSDWSAPIMTSPLPNVASEGSSAGLIAGIVICVLVVPIIIMLGVVFWKRHKNKPKLNYHFSTMELVSNGESIKIQDNLSFVDDVFETQDKCALDYPTDYSHPPVPIAEFSDYVAKMKERDYSFEDEFEELDDGIPREKLAAKNGDSKDHSNDKNSVPYDSFRVILNNQKISQSDYIGASMIDSYGKKNAYIATQTPLKDQIDDFWDMIWQNDVCTILILSHPLDTEKEKTACYWPSSSSNSTYGNIVVKYEDTTVDESSTARGFSIRCANSAERRIRLFQFTKWPQRGIPESPDKILRFRDHVNQWHNGRQGPIAVQCSKGSGRSGSYIALDAILNHIRQSKMVDIFNFVKYLRSRRSNMVETDRQYEFIHDLILEVLTKVEQNVEIDRKNANSVLSGLGKIDSLTGYTGFTRLFKQLNHSIPSVSSRNLEGSKAINDYKNRYSYKVPQDSYRVRLPIIGTTKADMSDYINATFVAINDESRFITTQAPFGITVNDFWTMVYFSRAEVIVMLNDIEENSVQFSQYWPGTDSLSATYGNFKVTLELESTPFPCVIRRDFTFSELKNPDVTREVSQFHVLAWEDHDVPPSPFAILQLSKYLASEYMMKEKAPIIVQCSDGFGRSGTFCACLHAVKQLMTEGKVHIPDMLRKFRKRHVSYVENEAQFKFIFHLARDFLESIRNMRY